MEIVLFAPLVLGLVQVVKETGMPSRFAPALAVGLGIVIAWYLNMDLVSGVIAGLTAVGLFSGTKSSVGK